ncbi:MAG: hypothetical protein IPL07_16355 [Acidimicrobiaceae bacterium]|nr:hypothetical protein [Acidimicrobiaceae bacterium]
MSTSLSVMSAGSAVTMSSSFFDEIAAVKSRRRALAWICPLACNELSVVLAAHAPMKQSRVSVVLPMSATVRLPMPGVAAMAADTGRSPTLLTPSPSVAIVSCRIGAPAVRNTVALRTSGMRTSAGKSARIWRVSARISSSISVV